MPSLVKIGPVVLEKFFFLIFQCIFTISKLYLLGKRWVELVEISPVVLEKIFFNFVNVFSLFRNYLPLR